MINQTLEEWQAEIRSKFASSDEVAFVCPACSKVSTVKDHINAGGTWDNDPQQCIGRTTGLGTKSQKDIGHGCNWAAFGFFRTLGKGRKVEFPEGSSVEVFDFAPEVSA